LAIFTAFSNHRIDPADNIRAGAQKK